MNRKRALIAGVLGGLVHFVVVGGLYVYLRGPELFGYSPDSNSFGLLEPLHLYVVLGAFLLGAVPAVLLVERRLVTPALSLLVFVVGILLSSPNGLEPRPRDAGVSNLGFYFLLWFVPLLVACFLGGVEYLAKYVLRVEDDHRSRNG